MQYRDIPQDPESKLARARIGAIVRGEISAPYRYTIGALEVRATRYRELGYACIEPGRWQIVAIDDGRESPIGERYHTKVELLADLDRFAAQYGTARL